MESYEILKQAVEKVGAKRVAAAMGVSTSLVYKWCERAGDPEDTSGARNPLDRLRVLLESTGDDAILQWVCQCGDGYFVCNPAIASDRPSTEYVAHTQKMLQDFSDLLRVMSESIANDGVVDCREAKRIRKEWEDLKRYGEQFVHACEEGLFCAEM